MLNINYALEAASLRGTGNREQGTGGTWFVPSIYSPEERG